MRHFPKFLKTIFSRRKAFSVVLGGCFLCLTSGVFAEGAVDSSGYDSHGVLHGGVGSVGGVLGGAMEFDGVDDFVTISNLQTSIFNGGGTFSMWVKPSVLTGTQVLMDRNGTAGYRLQVVDGVLQAVVGGQTIVGTPLDTSYFILATLVLDGSTLKIYQDGVEVGSAAYTGTIDEGTADLVLGSTGSGSWYSGTLDDFRVYDRPLSALEIQTLYEIGHDYATSGLVGHWTFDEGEGNVVRDESGNGNDGTIEGGTGFGEGVFNDGGVFDGVDDNVLLSGADYSGLSDFTISTWIKRSTTTNTDFIFHAEGAGKQLVLELEGNKVHFAVNNGGGWQDDYSDGQITDTDWHLLTVTLSQTDGKKVYIDGILDTTFASSKYSLATVGTAPYKIGQSFPGYGNRAMQGVLDDIKIYDRALSDVEILSEYLRSKPIRDDGLVGWWSFDEGYGPTVFDHSENNEQSTENNGVPMNGVVYTADGMVGTGMSFDGADDTVTISNSQFSISNEGTFSMWVKPSVLTGTQVLLDRNGGTGYQVRLNGADVEVTVGGEIVVSSEQLVMNNWVHVVASLDGTDLKVYQDGVGVATAAYTGTIDEGTADLILGSSGSADWYGGVLDEVKIYDRAITSAEVSAEYNLRKTSFSHADSVTLQEGSTLFAARAKNEADTWGEAQTFTANYDPSTPSIGSVDMGSGIGENTVLYIASDDVNGSQNFKDSSPSGHDITPYGDAKQSVSAMKFGATSMQFDGDGDYLTIPAHEGFNVGAEDFTVDFWVNFSSVSGTAANTPLYYGTTGERAFLVSYLANVNPSRWTFAISTDGTNWDVIINNDYDQPIGEWAHVAATRSGNDARVFINGIQIGTTQAISGTVYNSSSNLYIGASDTPAQFLDGYIDDFRITKGQALWTTDFTPPIRPHNRTSLSSGRAFNDNDIANDGQVSVGWEEPGSVSGDNYYYTTTSEDLTLREDLVGHWKLDESSGNIVVDSSENREHGTVNNGILMGQDGVLDGAMEFDGVDDYVSNFNLQTSIFNEGTFSMWVKPSVLTGTQVLMDRNGTAGYRLQVVDGVLQAVVGGQIVVSSEQLVMNNWVHLVVSLDGSTFKIYQDGVEVATAAYTGTIDEGTADLIFGSSGSANWYGGMMDDVKIYSRGLTALEVEKQYHAGRAFNDEGLVGWWSMDATFNLQASVFVVDNSDNNNHGELVNGVSLAAGQLGRAGSFDGADDFVTISNLQTSIFNGGGTFSMWVKPSVLTGTQVLMDRNGTAGYRLQVVDGVLQAVVGGQTIVGTPLDTSYFILATLVLDGSTLEIYQDGVEVATAAYTGTIDEGTADLMLGSSGSASWYGGVLDEVKIWDRSLTAAEVVNEYKLRKTTIEYLDDLTPAVGTEYIHVRGINKAGTAGAEEVYTMTYDPGTPEITNLDGGADSTDRTALDGSDVWFGPWVIGWDGVMSQSWTDPLSPSDDSFYYVNTQDTITPLHQDLVGWWNFDTEIREQRVENNVGDSGADGLVMGGATLVVDGKIESAMSFDGADDTVTISNSQFSISNEGTFSMWVKPSVLTGTQVLLDRNGTAGYRLQVVDGVLQAIVGGQIVVSSEQLVMNNWTHVIVALDGSTLKIYQDGVERASAAYTGTINEGVADLILGSTGSASWFSGVLDEVKIYSSALTAEDIAAEYNLQKTRFSHADGVTLQEGTNYIHVQAQNATGTRGSENVFTAKYDPVVPEIGMVGLSGAVPAPPIPPFTCGTSLLTDPRDSQTYATVQIGTQCWMAEHLNVGTMLASGSTNPANNATIEKWCYSNSTTNCDNEGGLYTWDEMMGYTTTQGTQGICPTGWHIPTDAEYKTLVESQATPGCESSTGWQCDPAGTALKSGGSSGFAALLAGYRSTNGSFGSQGSYAFLWSSTESGTYAWRRFLNSGDASVYRDTTGKADGYSVRCLQD